MKPAHAVAKNRGPVDIAGLEARCRFVRSIVEDDWRTYAVTAIAVNRGEVWPGHAIVIEPFIKWLDAHGPDSRGDQFADRIFHHRGDNPGLEPKAVREIGRDVIFTTADVNLTLLSFAKGNQA